MTGDHPTDLTCECGGPIWQWYGELPDGYSETFDDYPLDTEPV